MVGGQAITLSDARAAIALGLIEPSDGADPIAAPRSSSSTASSCCAKCSATRRPRRPKRRSTPRLDEIRKRCPAPAHWTRLLEATALPRRGCAPGCATMCGPRRIWRSGLRRRACPATPRCGGVHPRNALSSTRPADVRAGRADLRERLIASRRRELIADWLSELRRRTDVVDPAAVGRRFSAVTQLPQEGAQQLAAVEQRVADHRGHGAAARQVDHAPQRAERRR